MKKALVASFMSFGYIFDALKWKNKGEKDINRITTGGEIIILGLFNKIIGTW
jgi:hypothetical protein